MTNSELLSNASAERQKEAIVEFIIERCIEISHHIKFQDRESLDAEVEDFLKSDVCEANLCAARIFKCNEDGVAEWCVAANKEQAYEFMRNLWGSDSMKEYENDYYKDFPGSRLEDFIDDFFIEEPMDKVLTVEAEDGTDTRTVEQWLTRCNTIPSYFCSENF